MLSSSLSSILVKDDENDWRVCIRLLKWMNESRSSSEMTRGRQEVTNRLFQLQSSHERHDDDAIQCCCCILEFEYSKDWMEEWLTILLSFSLTTNIIPQDVFFNQCVFPTLLSSSIGQQQSHHICILLTKFISTHQLDCHPIYLQQFQNYLINELWNNKQQQQRPTSWKQVEEWTLVLLTCSSSSSSWDTVFVSFFHIQFTSSSNIHLFAWSQIIQSTIPTMSIPIVSRMIHTAISNVQTNKFSTVILLLWIASSLEQTTQLSSLFASIQPHPSKQTTNTTTTPTTSTTTITIYQLIRNAIYYHFPIQHSSSKTTTTDEDLIVLYNSNSWMYKQMKQQQQQQQSLLLPSSHHDGKRNETIIQNECIDYMNYLLSHDFNIKFTFDNIVGLQISSRKQQQQHDYTPMMNGVASIYSRWMMSFLSFSNKRQQLEHVCHLWIHWIKSTQQHSLLDWIHSMSILATLWYNLPFCQSTILQQCVFQPLTQQSNLKPKSTQKTYLLRLQMLFHLTCQHQNEQDIVSMSRQIWKHFHSSTTHDSKILIISLCRLIVQYDQEQPINIMLPYLQKQLQYSPSQKSVNYLHIFHCLSILVTKQPKNQTKSSNQQDVLSLFFQMILSTTSSSTATATFFQNSNNPLFRCGQTPLLQQYHTHYFYKILWNHWSEYDEMLELWLERILLIQLLSIIINPNDNYFIIQNDGAISTLLELHSLIYNSNTNDRYKDATIPPQLVPPTRNFTKDDKFLHFNIFWWAFHSIYTILSKQHQNAIDDDLPSSVEQFQTVCHKLNVDLLQFSMKDPTFFLVSSTNHDNDENNSLHHRPAYMLDWHEQQTERTKRISSSSNTDCFCNIFSPLVSSIFIDILVSIPSFSTRNTCKQERNILTKMIQKTLNETDTRGQHQNEADQKTKNHDTPFFTVLTLFEYGNSEGNPLKNSLVHQKPYKNFSNPTDDKTKKKHTKPTPRLSLYDPNLSYIAFFEKCHNYIVNNLPSEKENDTMATSTRKLKTENWNSLFRIILSQCFSLQDYYTNEQTDRPTIATHNSSSLLVAEKFMETFWNFYLSFCNEDSSCRLIVYLEKILMIDDCHHAIISSKSSSSSVPNNTLYDFSIYSLRKSDDVDIFMRQLRLLVVSCLENVISSCHSIVNQYQSETVEMLYQEKHKKNEQSFIDIWARIMSSLCQDLYSGLKGGHSGGITRALYKKHLDIVEKCIQIIHICLEEDKSMKVSQCRSSILKCCDNASQSLWGILCDFSLHHSNTLKQSMLMCLCHIPRLRRRVSQLCLQKYTMNIISSKQESLESKQIVGNESFIHNEYSILNSLSLHQCHNFLETLYRDNHNKKHIDKDLDENTLDDIVNIPDSNTISKNINHSESEVDERLVHENKIKNDEIKLTENVGLTKSPTGLRLDNNEIWSRAYLLSIQSAEWSWMEVTTLTQQYLSKSSSFQVEQLENEHTTTLTSIQHITLGPALLFHYVQNRTIELGQSLESVCKLFKPLESKIDLKPATISTDETKNNRRISIGAQFLPYLCKNRLCSFLERTATALKHSIRCLDQFIIQDTPHSCVKRENYDDKSQVRSCVRQGEGENMCCHVIGQFALVESISCLMAWLLPCSEATSFTIGTRKWYCTENYRKNTAGIITMHDDPILARIPKVLLRIEEMENLLQKLNKTISKKCNGADTSLETINYYCTRFNIKNGKQQQQKDEVSNKSKSFQQILSDHFQLMSRYDEGAFSTFDVPAISHVSIHGEIVSDSGRKRQIRNLVATKKLKKMRKDIPRSRNEVVDEWLKLDSAYSEDEGLAYDTYADLEEFIEDG